MTKTYLMNSLIEKMQSPDQDFRFMGLNDLMSEIKQDPNNLIGDETTESKVLKQVLSLVEDKISEVKNQAVKCLGQMIKIIRESQMDFVVDKLIEFSSGKDEELRDISALALKTITAELPPDSTIAPKACAKLAPKLLQQLSNESTTPQSLVENLSILSILIGRFPTYFSTSDLKPISILTPLLSHPRPVVRKRTITTLAQFIPVSGSQAFPQLLQSDILPNLAPSANIEKQRTTIQLLTSVARQSTQHISPVLGEITPRIISSAQRDDDELRESCLQALEALVLRCPSEITPFVNSIIQVGNQFIKHDPNYAAADDDEDEEMAVEDEDEDDAELDEYSDDEDTSYKIRRSATKLLAAVLSTRPELLSHLLKEVSPVLISRFGDRETTVRLEVWATYAVLLAQVGVYGGSPSKESDPLVGGKRKREEGMEVEETAYTILSAQVPSMTKSLLNQIKSPKTPPATLQAGFDLLKALLVVAPGCLANQTAQITSILKSVLSQPPTTTTSGLHSTTLTFISLFFSTHSPPAFTSSLPVLTTVLLKSLGERHPRVSAESFRAVASLLKALNPVTSGEWVDRVYAESVKRLSSSDTDADVRNSAEQCIGTLWICATDIMRTKNRKEWEAVCRTTGRTEGAVQVVTEVAREVEIGDDWVNGCVQWILVLLRKSGRSGKGEVFTCLEVLLQRYASGLPADLPATLIPQLHGYITTADISLLSQAVSIVALLLQLSPATTFPEVESELLKDVYTVSYAPPVSGTALDSLLSFFSALVAADVQIAAHVVLNLMIAVDKAAKSEASYANVARCIAQVVKSQQGIAAGTITEFTKHLKSPKSKPSLIVLSLLTLGELGRFIDMSLQQDIFGIVIERFADEQEDIRAAAAFAAGNIAIGNLNQFLPVLVKMVETDPEKRLLSLHSLKEVVTHSSHGQLEGIVEILWVPLFENSDNTEEITRNVAAACLGKLSTTHPSRYLPQLHSRIKDETPASRATVVAAIRYTFAESSPAFDELLGPLIIDFLGLMQDTDLTVRRLALSALNSAARTKAYLVRDHLPQLLPSLYEETVVKPELIRTVQMGPWTHKVDDGLEARKTAYETLYTLLDTCLNKIDLHEFLGRVIAGLADESDEIKVICHMMLFRLSQLGPTAVSQRLDDVTPHLQKSMEGAKVTKDTVKQDLERATELQRSTLRAVAALSKITSTGSSVKFDAFLETVRKDPTWGAEFKDLQGA